MSVGYMEVTEHGEAIKDAAKTMADARKENSAELKKQNELKLVELILIHGAEKVQAALKMASSKVEIEIPEKKVSRVPSLRPNK